MGVMTSTAIEISEVLLVASRGDKLEVEWVRSHSDGRGAWASLNKH